MYKGERLVGQGEDSAVVFRYSDEYLSEQAAPPVALTLPRNAEPVRAGGESVPPFFAGLLPEGIRLRAIVAGTRTSADDHLTLLLAVGQDAIGDVRAVPAGATPAEPPVTLVETEIGSVDLVEVFAAATSTSAGRLERVALPGVQEKVSAALVPAPLGTSAGPAILKLNPPSGHHRLVENEHFFLRMAAACGLPTPDARLVRDRLGRAGLLVARFDRLPQRGGRSRLAQEDACQPLGRYPASKYRLKTEDVITVLAATVGDGGGSRLQALRRTLELVGFSYLIGNGDLHGKNFSARQNPAGPWEVTPAYDLVFTQPYLRFDDPMALNLYGRANRLDPLRTVALAWIDRLGEIGFDERTTERLAELVRGRLRELG